ncbi:hypothetical protein EOD40_04775 [Flavobacterium sufflavum]|uniref:Uncharacterized protein n=1 Tax=Flavobacterium sufflavum TaxID=1921138 RepID=A0A437L0S9_9FLAO|nr:hypothetical protein [Flavobacterium sufflavum]RVT78552.1 hypothetical protein EOD40_04775 [Flavobacterium sufflavum]
MIEERNISFSEHQEEFEKYENSITIYEITDKETVKQLGGNIGDKYTTKRIPQTKEEAFERLIKYDAMRIFFALVENFNDKYSLNIKTLRDELDTINEFIESAEKIKIDEATNIYNKNFNPSKRFENEYIKLKYGHYEKKNYNNYFSFFDSITATVKAKYFLYKECLEHEIKKIEEFQSPLYDIFCDKSQIINFNKYTKLHIVEPYIDYSYLFQRLLNENIITKIPHLNFAELLFRNKYINENIMDTINKNSGFRTLKKSFSAQRENNFNNVFNR